MGYIIKTDLLFHSSGFGGNNLDRVQHCGEGRSIGTRLDCRAVLSLQRAHEPESKRPLGVFAQMNTIHQIIGDKFSAMNGRVHDELNIITEIDGLQHVLVEDVGVDLHIHLLLVKSQDFMLYLAAACLQVPGLRPNHDYLAREPHGRAGKMYKRLHVLDDLFGGLVRQDLGVGEVGFISVGEE